MIAVLDYGIGNLRSAEKALQHVGADARLVDDPDAAVGAGGIVLPGVGAFGPCARALRDRGFDGLVRQAVAGGTPFLGICVGFQLLYEGSEESPDAPGLGLFEGVVRRLPDGVKRPQMQWNRLRMEPRSRPEAGASLFDDVAEGAWVYFVHSYAPERTADTSSTCEYGETLTASAERDRLFGVQFHPEKSGTVGLSILSNFVGVASVDRGRLDGGGLLDRGSAS